MKHPRIIQNGSKTKINSKYQRHSEGSGETKEWLEVRTPLKQLRTNQTDES